MTNWPTDDRLHTLNADIGQEDGEEDGEEIGDVLEWSQDLTQISGLKYTLNHSERHLCNKKKKGYNRAIVYLELLCDYVTLSKGFSLKKHYNKKHSSLLNEIFKNLSYILLKIDGKFFQIYVYVYIELRNWT